MTLEQLRIFVAVAELGHVTRAAARLNLTQSAVSAAVSALEQRHGTRLFDRIGRAIVLNQTGEIFLDHARRVLAEADRAQTALDDLAGMRRGRLSVMASQTVCAHWLPARLAAYRRAYPQITLEVSIGNTTAVAAAVARAEVEIGLVEGDVAPEGVARRQIDSDALIVVAAPDHPLAGRSPDAQSLTEAEWVLREPGSGTRRALDALMTREGIAPGALRIAITLPGNAAVLGAVRAGMGITLTSASAAQAMLDAGQIARLDVAALARPFWLLHHTTRSRSRAAEAFETMLEMPPISGSD